MQFLLACYNEVENIELLYAKLNELVSDLNNYDFEFLFIDNASIDGTVDVLRKLAKADTRVKVILNSRNFGYIRSPYYGLLQTDGDAVIYMATDFQDPPELVLDFINKWEGGDKLVLGVKNKSKENQVMFFVRKVYYYIIKKFSEVEQINNFTGFGLYDRSFIDILRGLNEYSPYLRGLVGEFGFKRSEIFFTQPVRERGSSNGGFYVLYDLAMNGFVNHSKLPLRLASLIGFTCSIISVVIAIIYFIMKLMHWNDFQFGLATLVTGLFFFSAVQLFFIGVVGEYVGAIYTQVKKRPLVVEAERINFNNQNQLK